jgi:hypothetical protein
MPKGKATYVALFQGVALKICTMELLASKDESGTFDMVMRQIYSSRTQGCRFTILRLN